MEDAGPRRLRRQFGTARLWELNEVQDPVDPCAVELEGALAANASRCLDGT